MQHGPLMRTFAGVAWLGLVVGCAGGGQPPTPPSDTMAGLTSIDISPSTVALISSGPAVSSQFAATGHFNDGHSADITALVAWALDDYTIGAIDKGQFVS